MFLDFLKKLWLCIINVNKISDSNSSGLSITFSTDRYHRSEILFNGNSSHVFTIFNSSGVCFSFVVAIVLLLYYKSSRKRVFHVRLILQCTAYMCVYFLLLIARCHQGHIQLPIQVPSQLCCLSGENNFGIVIGSAEGGSRDATLCNYHYSAHPWCVHTVYICIYRYHAMCSLTVRLLLMRNFLLFNPPPPPGGNNNCIMVYQV